MTDTPHPGDPAWRPLWEGNWPTPEEPERKILMSPHNRAQLPEGLKPYAEVSPLVPADMAYIVTLPPIFEDIEFDRSLLPYPRARCVITDPRLDPPSPR